MRRLEAVALEQERVGEEAQQLLNVVDVAVAQVLAGLRDGARRCGRECGHLGIGLGLAAEREQRDAARGAALAQRVEAVDPAAPAAEDAAQNDARAVEQILEVDAVGGVGPADLRELPAEPLDRGRASRGSRCRRWSQSGAREHLRLEGGQAGRRAVLDERGEPRRCRGARRRGRRGRRGAPRGRRRTLSCRRRSDGRAPRRRARAARGGTRRAPARRARRGRRTLPARQPSLADQRLAAVALGMAVADLVAGDLAAEPVAEPRRPAQQLVGCERVVTGRRPSPSTAPRRDSTSSLDAVAEQLVPAADAEDRVAGRGTPRQRAVEAVAAQALEVLDGRLGTGEDDEVGALDVRRPSA